MRVRYKKHLRSRRPLKTEARKEYLASLGDLQPDSIVRLTGLRNHLVALFEAVLVDQREFVVGGSVVTHRLPTLGFRRWRRDTVSQRPADCCEFVLLTSDR